MKHILPVPSWCVETQSFAEHEARAKSMGCCSKPGSNCSCYYYGALDLAPPWSRANEDIPIYASAGGACAIQDQSPTGYGLHIRQLTDDNELVIYGHLSRTTVGAWAKQGDIIGWMGNTGNSTGKHIHWEIRVNGIPVDPRLKMAEVDEPEPTDPEVLPTFPQPVMFRLRDEYDWLSIRTKPWGSVIGAITNHNAFPVFNTVTSAGGETWLQIGYNQVCAYKTSDGKRWTEFVE